MKKKTILFDFDGTIADSLPRLLEISNSMSEEYGYQKVSSDKISYFRNKSILETFKELKVPLLKVPIIANRVKRTFQQEAHLSLPFEGIDRVIRQLSGDHNLGILTSNDKKSVQKFLDQQHLACFQFIYSSSHIFRKGKALKRILKEKMIDPKQTVYVGDEVRDIEAAHYAGTVVVSVSWGANNKKALAKLRPDYLIDKPQELLTILS